MANLFDYLAWRGDLDFEKSPFNPVDNIIFSQLSYLPFDGIVPGPDEKDGISIRLAASIFNEKLENNTSHIKSSVMFKEDPLLINTLASSSRFGDCRLLGYVNHIDTVREIQFSAYCVYTGDDSCFIVFRGTDFTFVGWKEDFNMSFNDSVPAQLEAVEYLKKMALRFKGPLRVGGHSKGGNLAVYAAANCGEKVQKRITEIYSNDAPGFHESVISGAGFVKIRDRVHSFIPQSSVVGMLLEHGCDYSVIKSSKIGLLQHELYSWEVTRNDMVHVDEVTVGSRFVDKTLRTWIAALNDKDREKFINALFSILSASRAKSIPELEKNWLKAAGRMLKSLGNTDESTRHLLRKTLAELFNAARRNIDTFEIVQKISLINPSSNRKPIEIDIEAKLADYV